MEVADGTTKKKLLNIQYKILKFNTFRAILETGDIYA